MANPRNLAKIAPIVSATSGKLILSDTATLNGGTANSLVYLNANKEATTVSTLSFNGTNLGVNNTSPGSALDVKGVFRLTGSVSGYIGLQAATTGTNQTYTLPASDGLNGQVLQTNGVGSLSWVNQTAGGGGGSSGSGTSTSRTAFTATEGQTTFNVDYVVGQVDVYLNGSKLLANNDFTATSGNTVVLEVGATAGSVVEAVVYSSQLITSGVNLYYTAGNIGVGTTNPASKIHVASANTALAVGTIRIDGADSAGTVNAPVTINAATGGATGNGGSQLYFETRADGGSLTERMRIDQRGNVGFGAVPSSWAWNSPAVGAALDVGSVGSIFSLAGETGVGTEITRNVYYSGSSWIHKTEGAASRFEQSGGVFRWFNAPFALSGNTASFVERMRLNADGNLGLGTTPSAWQSGTKAIEWETGAIWIRPSQNYSEFVTNAYFNGSSWVYTRNAPVMRYQQGDGAHVWWSAPSGNTANTVIFGTPKMVLTANGDVGLGISTPARQFVVYSTNPTIQLADAISGTTAAAGSILQHQSTNQQLAIRTYDTATGNGAISFQTGGASERARITNTGNVGINTTNPSVKLHVENTGYGTSFIASAIAETASQVNIGIGVLTVGRPFIGTNTSSNPLEIGTRAATETIFVTNSTEKMRLDASGNLGIGTTSPGAKLEVNVPGTTGTSSALQLSRGSGYGTTDFKQYYTSGTDYGLIIGNTVSDYLTLNLASGNLGLGVTPSASWASSFGVIQGLNQYSISTDGSSSNTFQLASNAVRTASGSPGSWNYLATAQATIYQQRSGAHSWFTAPSGTAGNAISFTQAMTLDASGNWEIGNASTAVSNTTRTASIKSSNIGNLVFGITQNATTMGAPATSADIYTTSALDMRFGTSGLERARITSGGNLLLGTTTETGSGRLRVVNNVRIADSSSETNALLITTTATAATIETRYATPIILGTDGGERARIDSSGNFLVGTTTVGAGLTDGFSLQMGGGASQIHIGHTSGIGSGELYAGFSRGGTTIGSISQNGTTAVLFNTTSDRRLKDNIAPAPSASGVIDAIEIVSHDWKSAPDEHVTYGVIAQDLALVAPQAVLQGDDGDEIERTWGVDYSKLVPMLIKEIQSLRARVADLEAKLPE